MILLTTWLALERRLLAARWEISWLETIFSINLTKKEDYSPIQSFLTHPTPSPYPWEWALLTHASIEWENNQWKLTVWKPLECTPSPIHIPFSCLSWWYRIVVWWFFFMDLWTFVRSSSLISAKHSSAFENHCPSNVQVSLEIVAAAVSSSLIVFIFVVKKFHKRFRVASSLSYWLGSILTELSPKIPWITENRALFTLAVSLKKRNSLFEFLSDCHNILA